MGKAQGREVEVTGRTSTKPPSLTTFLEILPMLCLLIFVIYMIGFSPTLDPVQYLVRQEVDMEALENVLNNTVVGKP